ncbi:hypothetical protein [Pseudobutyrivibrio sp.]
MDKSKIKSRYDKALELKGREQYAKALEEELTKPIWTEKLAEITTRMESIGSEKEYEKVMGQLALLFDEVYEKIAAPGLDKFIEWIKGNSKNETNADKLREFLIKDYEKYSTKIDDILVAIDSLPDEKEEHVFKKLVSDFKSKQKSIVSKFINEPNLFVNAIDTFLSDLKTEHEGLSRLSELSYTSIDELYNDEQKKDTTISFYVSIINNAIAEGQSLKEIDDTEKNQKLWTRAQSRISSVKRCIAILVKTGIAKSKDEDLKFLFSRFDKEMLQTKGDVSRVLDDYIEKTWTPLQDKYNDIKAFYEEEELDIDNNDWSDYEKKPELDYLLSSYRSVRAGNVLQTLKSAPLDKVASTIKKCHSSIDELQTLENNTRVKIKQHIEDFYKQYAAKRSMLEKLVAKQDSLQSLFDSLYSENSRDKFLPNIKSGYESLSSEGSLLLAMSKDNATIYETLSDMTKAKDTFMNILKQSQMEEQIEWINSFGDNTTIDTTNFDYHKIEDLLEKGLITLSFTKTF